MRFVSFVAGTATVVALSSCQMSTGLGPKSETTAPVPTTASCGAEELSFMVGMIAADVNFGERHAMRIVAPDTAVTMDHNPERLNVHTDKSGKITSLTCG